MTHDQRGVEDGERPPPREKFGPHTVGLGDLATYAHARAGQPVQGEVTAVSRTHAYVQHGPRHRHLGPGAMVPWAEIRDVQHGPSEIGREVSLPDLGPDAVEKVAAALGVSHLSPEQLQAIFATLAAAGAAAGHSSSRGKWYWTKSRHIRSGEPPGPGHATIHALGPEHLGVGHAVEFETPEGNLLGGTVQQFGAMGASIHVAGAAGDVVHKVPYHAIRTVTPAEAAGAEDSPGQDPAWSPWAGERLARGDLVEAELHGRLLRVAAQDDLAGAPWLHAVDEDGVYRCIPRPHIRRCAPGKGWSLLAAHRPVPTTRPPREDADDLVRAAPDRIALEDLTPGAIVDYDTGGGLRGRAVIANLEQCCAAPSRGGVTAFTLEGGSHMPGAFVALRPDEITRVEPGRASVRPAHLWWTPTPAALDQLRPGHAVQYAWGPDTPKETLTVESIALDGVYGRAGAEAAHRFVPFACITGIRPSPVSADPPAAPPRPPAVLRALRALAGLENLR